MNEFSDLEAELKQLQPRAVSPELVTRIETALAREATSTPTAGMLPRRQKLGGNWLAIALGLGATAAFVTVALVSVDRAPRDQHAKTATNNSSPAAAVKPSNGFVPDGMTRVVYNTRDEGLVYSRTSAEPVRRVRFRAHETLHWTEPGTGASLRVSYPTDEIELTPVSGQ